MLALHVAAAWLLWRPSPWLDRGPPTQAAPPLTWVRLPPAAAPRQVATPPPAHRSRPRAGSAERRREARTVAVEIAGSPPPNAPTAAAVAPEGPERGTSPAGSSAADATAAPTPTAPEAPALDLRLPRGGWRITAQPALPTDPRTVPGLESSIAAALGSVDGIVVEPLDADRLRVRRGTRCVEMRRSRAGQLDPSGPFRDLWQGRPC